MGVLSCVIPPGFFSFLNCHLPPIAFHLVVEETFLSLLLGEIEAGPARRADCTVVYRLLSRKPEVRLLLWHSSFLALLVHKSWCTRCCAISFHCFNIVGKALEGTFCIKSFTSTVTSAGVTFGVPVRTEFWTDGVPVNDSVLPLPTPSQ